MARISAVGTFLDGDPSDALEWIVGDVATIYGQANEDEDGDAIDLTGATITVTIEL